MRREFRAFASAALLLAIAIAFVPVQAAVPQRQSADCCARMSATPHGDDCGKHAPSSQKEQQCCAACSMAFMTVLKSAEQLVPPFPTERRFPSCLIEELSRSEKPPVPPPRTLA